MPYYSGCDAHKNYSVFVGIDEHGCIDGPTRVDHNNGELDDYLSDLPEGTRVAIETVGNWYWLADKIENAGHHPRLTHAKKAKLMMGNTNKTDKLDAEGLAMLQKSGTLPEVWIAPGELRDQREALRCRVKLGRARTRWKNRIQALLGQHRAKVHEVSDTFGKQGRERLEDRLDDLPQHTRASVREQLKHLDQIEQLIQTLEGHLKGILDGDPEYEWIQTMPGFGPILSAIAVLEVGDVSRFPGPGNLASYAGTTPKVYASGDREHYGSVRKDVNQTLKWAMFEAANVVIRHQDHLSDSRLVRKYQKVSQRVGSKKAKGAVARMLAESVYWVLTKEEPYKEPKTP